MTEWGVVGVLAALAALAATLVTPMIKLNTALTRLVVLVEELADKLAALERENGSAHEKLGERISRLGSSVGAHETRITVMERNGGNNADKL